MWVVAALATLAALIVFALCVPLDVALRMDVYGRPKFRMRLVWLFGMVSKEVRRGKKRPEEAKRVVEGKRKPRDRRREARGIFKILRTKGLLRQLWGLVRSVLNRLKIRELGANLRVGLDNPADTGLLFAFIAPANLLLSFFSPHQIRVQPSFADEAVFEGYLYGATRLWPIQLVAPLIGFVFSLPTLRAVKTLVLTKWKRKR